MISFFRKIISNWIRKDPVKALITIFIGSAHGIFILFLCFYPSMHKAKSSKKMVVKTFNTAPTMKAIARPASKPATSTASTKPKSDKPKALPAALPTPSKPKATPPAPKKKIAKPKTPAKPKVTPTVTKPITSSPKKTPEKAPPKKPEKKNIEISKELINELEERIAKIDAKRDKIPARGDISIPKSVDSLFTKEPMHFEVERISFEQISNYGEFLTTYLQEMLRLPDFGEVKVQITVAQDGSVVRYAVVKAESDKNKKYLEEKLTSLHFPEFKGKGITKPEETFVLTFCNEI